MNQTELVLMPGADYRQICDQLRELLNTNALIPSWMASDMFDTVKSNIDATDDVLSGLAEDTYYNNRLTALRSYAFAYSKITSLLCPNVTKTGGYSCSNCKSLKKAKLPNLTSGGTNALFVSCFVLEHADLGKTDSVSSNTFLSCSSLKRVVLRRKSLSSLQSINAFTGTPFASDGSGGKIYVPQALIEAYKTATNWSVLYGYGNCEFVAIEGSEYE